MPFNGSGTFSRLYSWVVDAANSVNISSTRTDAEMNGFAAALTNCVTRDGQSPPSADLPMGGKKLVNLGAATVGTDALNRDTADARYLASTSALPHTITFNNSGAGAASGAVFDVTANITVSSNTLGAAPLASPTFTGVPAAPTAVLGTNTTQLATTAFVAAGFAPLTSPTLTGVPAAPTAAGGTNSTQIATTAFVAAGFAPLASPTLTGTPAAPTAAVGTSTTQLATTGYVMTAKAPAGQTIASSATVTPTFSDDFIEITAQAAGLTLANPTGTPANMWGIAIRIKDNGTPQTIAYGTQYRGAGVTPPTTTVATKTTVIGMIFNNALTKWDVVSVAQE